MDVMYAILADAAEVAPSGKFSLLGAGVETFSSPTYPLTTVAVYLVVRLGVTKEECGHPHHFRLEIHDSDGQNVLPNAVTHEFTPNEEPAVSLDLPISFLVVIALTLLTFPTPGKYLFRLFVDDIEVTTLPIVCKQTNEKPTETEEVPE